MWASTPTDIKSRLTDKLKFEVHIKQMAMGKPIAILFLKFFGVQNLFFKKGFALSLSKLSFYDFLEVLVFEGGNDDLDDYAVLIDDEGSGPFAAAAEVCIVSVLTG